MYIYTLHTSRCGLTLVLKGRTLQVACFDVSSGACWALGLPVSVPIRHLPCAAHASIFCTGSCGAVAEAFRNRAVKGAVNYPEITSHLPESCVQSRCHGGRRRQGAFHAAAPAHGPAELTARNVFYCVRGGSPSDGLFAGR